MLSCECGLHSHMYRCPQKEMVEQRPAGGGVWARGSLRSGSGPLVPRAGLRAVQERVLDVLQDLLEKLPTRPRAVQVD